jgi:nicotinamidase-related amidase
MSRRLAALAARARQARVPVIYVNDNFGRWQSDWRKVVEHCRDEHRAGHALVERLLPREDDYFVLKPKHSGFHSTSLEILLRHLGADTLIVTGLATDLCVLFTANDAHMRDYRVLVPRDCTAAETPRRHVDALAQMRRALDVTTTPSPRLRLDELRSGRGRRAGAAPKGR